MIRHMHTERSSNVPQDCGLEHRCSDSSEFARTHTHTVYILPLSSHLKNAQTHTLGLEIRVVKREHLNGNIQQSLNNTSLFGVQNAPSAFVFQHHFG